MDTNEVCLMKNLDHMTTFIKVVETKSFTRASHLQNISRAAVSKQIRMLEEELGVTLLERSTRSVALTEEGRLVYEECLTIRDTIESMQAMLSGLQKEPSGQLSVVCGPVFANTYIVPHLAKFMARYPKIKLILNFGHQMPNMQEEKIDVVIAVYGAASPDAVQRCVIRTRPILCASPSYLKKSKKIQSLEDLLEHPVIIHPISPRSTAIEVRGGKTFNVQPSAIMNDQLAIKQCALNGAGVAFLQHHVVQEELKKGQLVELLPQYMETHDTIAIYLYYLSRRFLHSKIRAFVDFVSEQVRVGK